MPVINEKNYDLSSTYAFRAEKLAAYAQKLGSDAKLAQILGISPSRLHHIIRNRDVPFTEKMARAIEARLGKPYGWLDTYVEGKKINDNFNLPVYYLEDINEVDGINGLFKIKPATFYKYISNIPNAFFIKITNLAYAPKISPRSLVLVNPNETILENGCVYVLSYLMNEIPMRAVIRKYENNKFVDYLTNEIEDINDYIVYGKCKHVIHTELS